MTSPVFVAYIDGACRGNPGPAACATAITCDGVVILKAAKYLGHATNNRAEYCGLLLALEKAAKFEKCTELEVRTDSQLIARQVRGVYKIKDEGLRALNDKAARMIRERFAKFKITEIPREKNNIADSLANKALDLAKQKKLSQDQTAEFAEELELE